MKRTEEEKRRERLDNQERERRRLEAEEMKRTEEEKRRAEVRRAEERRRRDEQLEMKKRQGVDNVNRQESKVRRKFKLTPERRRKLKLLIMKKAMEDLKLEAEKKVMQREEYLATKVKPLNLDGLSEKDVVRLCESLYRQILVLHGETYDLEMKLCQQDYEINEAG